MVQDTIRAEFERFVGAAPYERTPDLHGYRNGSYPRILKTRVGTLVLEVPRDRASRVDDRSAARRPRRNDYP